MKTFLAKLFKNKETYEQERVGDYITTYTGKKFYALDPRPEDISIEDVAHSLSNLCRFTGHGKRFYSVAEHSIGCAVVAKEQGYSTLIQLYALLHDASESVVNDLARPVKQSFPEYKKVEDKIMSVMWKVFNIPSPTKNDYEIIKRIDNTLLINEMRDLMHQVYSDGLDYIDVAEPFDLTRGFDAGQSKETFLSIYYQLIEQYQKQSA